ncbi:ABC transporter substrate-binding protein [Thermomonospora umbrina]|uniref:Carbohydrate ABC transporter substrate-binding protein (CUT1 family) n=1 Tax=Thermomonospora umbrina TaxID=111806 RepID=A0A3D9SXQ2_9ACTN|nr:extracellular solute-binding protein [Thermomonospora umbrina]REE98833.1 carbohydrate ABC transporter substrate-binding protein (CUT1 family) [Thermomonospora umbrina]
MPSIRMRATALTAGAAMLALAGCSGGDSGESKTELRLYNDKGAWSKFFDQMGAQSKQEIGLNMKPVGYTDEPSYTAFIKASFRTKVKPDLFTWSTGGRLEEIVRQNQVAETTDIWQQAIKSGDLTQGLAKYYTVNGKQYCVPLNTAYWGMFYNKKIFAQHKLEPPKTWNDLMTIAETLKSKGQVPFNHTTPTSLFSFVWFEQLLAGTDPDLYERLGTGKASFTDPGVVKVMEQWKGMIDKGWFSNPGDKNDPADHFKSGKAAMVSSGTWFNTSMTQRGLKQGDDYGFFFIPNVNAALPQRSLIFESGPLCSLRKAPDVAASTKYLKWWITPSAQEKWANSRGDVSGNPKVKVADPELSRITKDAADPQNRLVLRFFEAVPAPVLTAALDGLGGFLVKPDTYMKVLETIQKANEEYWKNAGS